MADIKLLYFGVFVLPILQAHLILDVKKYFKASSFDEFNQKNVRYVNPDTGLSMEAFMKRYQYPLESHTVTTDDGYVLTLHRIPHGKEENDTILENSAGQKPVVLLMHGIICSSMIYVNMGPGKSLGLVLADAGYDVWIGNNRGNTYARKHVTLNPDKNDSFWDFSFHEHGMHDLPATIDYILNMTKADKLSYVGHSQGTTQFFALMSEKPEYNEKITISASLAPVVYLGHIPNPIFNLFRSKFNDIFESLQKLHLYELVPYQKILYDVVIARIICSNHRYQNLCVIILNLIGGGFDLNQLDPKIIPVILSSLPAGGSLKQAWHLAQGILSDDFRKFDYGVTGNERMYNQSVPPNYNLSRVTAPTALYFGHNDWFVSLEDFDRLADELPNCVQKHMINRKTFNHLDFLWSKDIYSLLNVHVLNTLNSYNGMEQVSTSDTQPTVPPTQPGSTITETSSWTEAPYAGVASTVHVTAFTIPIILTVVLNIF